MKTYYSDPTANAVIAKITREEKRAEKRRKKREMQVWRPDMTNQSGKE